MNIRGNRFQVGIVDLGALSNSAWLSAMRALYARFKSNCIHLGDGIFLVVVALYSTRKGEPW